MAHIHTTPGDHDHTVTGYIVRTDTPEPMALLHMHRKMHILLPVGGHVELHETPWQAMAHELTEESGYTFQELAILQPAVRVNAIDGAILHPYPIAANTHSIDENHYHSDTSYALIATDVPSLKIKAGESADIRWLTQAEIQALTPSEIYTNTRQVYTFIFEHALHQWDSVPAVSFSLEKAPLSK